MKTNQIVLILALIIITGNLFAENVTGKITGTVKDKESNSPLSYVTIAVLDSNDSTVITGTVTNESGFFELDIKEEGSYHIVVSYIGFKDKDIDDVKVNSRRSMVDLGTILLEINTDALDEVVVEAKSSVLINKVDKQVINVGSNLTTTGGSAVDAVKMSPSITVDSENNVLLRGSSKFTVLINGQPTSLSPQEVLSSTPADIIKSIEVITNPSVKYSAEGGAGIINIILKSDLNRGFNGSVNVTAGTKDKYSSNIALNLNLKKLSMSASFDWKDWTKLAWNDYTRDLFKGDTVIYAYMLQDRTIRTKDLAVRYNIGYTPNKNTNFSYSLNAGRSSWLGEILTENGNYSVPASTETHKMNSFLFDMTPTFFTNNFTISHTLNEKGDNITSNTYYSYIDYYMYNGQVFSLADENFNIIDDQPYKLDVLNENFSHDIRQNIDYTKVISEKTSLESGLAFERYTRFLDVTYDQFDYTVNDFVSNPMYTNKYDYYENIYGAYVNLITKLGEYNITAGMRVEYTDRLLKQVTLEEGYDFSGMNYFPGFSISRNLGKGNLSLALTNRINRPDEYMMNPFPEFEDDYFYNEGNPDLIPEIVRSLDLGYNTMVGKVMISSNLYYKRTENKIDQRLTIRESDDKILTTMHNNCNDESLGLELSLKSQPFKWWMVMLNGNGYHYSIEADIDGAIYANANFSYNAMLMNSFNITKTTSLQAISYYTSKTYRSQGDLSGFYFVDLALEQKLFNDKFSINFQVKDVLQSQNFVLSTNSVDMNLKGDFKNESPIYLLTVKYNISTFDKKTKDVDTEFDM